MAPLLRNLLGGSKERELTEETKELLQQIRSERERIQSLFNDSESATSRLEELAEPINKAESGVEDVESGGKKPQK